MRFLQRQGILTVAFFLILTTLVFYLPLLLHPPAFLQRGNDLQEYYWPIAYYIKDHFWKEHTFPLWNNMFFSGSPLISDPGSLLFYPPNFIFLLLPINTAFVTSFVLHTLLGGVGAYLAARKGFGFSRISSTLTALFYITFPRNAGFLEAGHFVFVVTTAWLPFVLLSTIKTIKSPNFFWSALLAISLSGLFFSFVTIFVITAIGVFLVLFWAGALRLLRKSSPKVLVFSFLVGLLTLGFTANTFFPEIEWMPHTTRFVLLKDRDVYPKWKGKSEFIKALYPELLGRQVYDLDTEKWLATGVFISILSLVGFLKLKPKYKILIFFLVLGTVLVSLNNISPISSFLLASDWFVLGRVATRLWFINVLTFVFLAAFGFESLRKTQPKISLALAFLAILEMTALSWVWMGKPQPSPRETVPASLYDFLKSDQEIFRIFCVTRCLSQQDVARNTLQTIEGYGTIYQKNYYDYFIQLSQVYWDRYAPTLPPASIYNFRQIQPIASILGDHNVKYVITPYPLKDPAFKPVKQFDKFLVYENSLARPRAYFYARGTKSEIEAPLFYYSPNKMVIDTSKHKASKVVIAETWSPGWKAKTDGGQKIKVSETPNRLMEVGVEERTRHVELYYYPESYRLGKAASMLAVGAVFAYSLFFVRRKKWSGTAL